jgi:hypothetical protein
MVIVIMRIKDARPTILASVKTVALTFTYAIMTVNASVPTRAATSTRIAAVARYVVAIIARKSVNVIVPRHTLAMTTADVIALTSVAATVIAAVEYA